MPKMPKVPKINKLPKMPKMSKVPKILNGAAQQSDSSRNERFNGKTSDDFIQPKLEKL
jgi:hypothetical protein